MFTRDHSPTLSCSPGRTFGPLPRDLPGHAPTSSGRTGPHTHSFMFSWEDIRTTTSPTLLCSLGRTIRHALPSEHNHVCLGGHLTNHSFPFVWEDARHNSFTFVWEDALPLLHLEVSDHTLAPAELIAATYVSCYNYIAVS